MTPPRIGIVLDPYLLLKPDFAGYLMSFDGAVHTAKNGGDGGYGFVIWKLPEWTVVSAGAGYCESATVNEAEYHGMLSGLKKARDIGLKQLIICGDSRIAIQQAANRIKCHSNNLQLLLTQFRTIEADFADVKLIHVIRKYNQSADYLASRGLKEKDTRIITDVTEIDNIRSLNTLNDIVYEPEVMGISTEANKQNSVPTDHEPPHCTSGEMPLEAWAVNKQCIGDHDAGTINIHAELDVKTEETDVKAEDDGSSWSSIAAVDATPEENLYDAMVTLPHKVVGASRFADDESTVFHLHTMHKPQVVDTGEITDVQIERLKRIGCAQDEEADLATLKCFLRGEQERIGAVELKRCKRIAKNYCLDRLGVLYFTKMKGTSRDSGVNEAVMRLVVPSNLIDDVMKSWHDEIQGGQQGINRTYHKIRRRFYWANMYEDIKRHVLQCADCETGKGRADYMGLSPGNVVLCYPFQAVSMDFIIPLPKSHRGNTALLLFQCMFTGYMVCKPMSSTTAEEVAKAYEGCIFRHYGASEFVRHDRDPRFMSEVFVEFNRMMKQRQKATLSYRPQANGQQERAVQTVIRSVKLYAEDPEQRDWDDLAERLMFAINTSYDHTRRDTPAYLLRGWDPKSTLEAMIPSVPGKE